MSNNNIVLYLHLIHGVRSGIFLYQIDFFLHFPSQEKKAVFHSSIQAENYFGQVVFKPEVCKSFVNLFYHMGASPVPYSVQYLQWRVQPIPRVFYSVFRVSS